MAKKEKKGKKKPIDWREKAFEFKNNLAFGLGEMSNRMEAFSEGMGGFHFEKEEKDNEGEEKEESYSKIVSRGNKASLDEKLSILEDFIEDLRREHGITRGKARKQVRYDRSRHESD